jgi:hypothetical protein
MVTATLISFFKKCQPRFGGGYFVGAAGTADTGNTGGAGAASTGAGVTGAASALDGIFNFLPTAILVVVRPFAASIALTVVP